VADNSHQKCEDNQLKVKESEGILFVEESGNESACGLMNLSNDQPTGAAT
jgi:hypothetical protein